MRVVVAQSSLRYPWEQSRGELLILPVAHFEKLSSEAQIAGGSEYTINLHDSHVPGDRGVCLTISRRESDQQFFVGNTRLRLDSLGNSSRRLALAPRSREYLLRVFQAR